MFSTNQKFEISGDNQQLCNVIDFAVRMADCIDMFTRSEARVVPAFQKTKTGLYVIGTGTMRPNKTHPDGIEVSRGWTDYQFDYDPQLIAGIVLQWLAQQPCRKDPTDGYDGGHEHGFICRSISSLTSVERESIERHNSGIIAISKYPLFYAK